MKQSLQRYTGPVSFFLVSCALFAACGGLDPRKVTRGPDEPVGGRDSMTDGGTGSGAVTGKPKPGAGGSESSAGGVDSPPDNPFGGATFSGGAPPVVDGPPEVLKVNPADGADDGEPDDSVSLLFSEGLDDATVISDNIKIMDGDTEVEGDLSYSGVVATFEPSSRLSLLATYDVSVSQGVTDTVGQGLKEKFASSFTVREGAWGRQTQALEEQELWGYDQEYGIDARGNTLVVWPQRVSTMDSTRRIMARWYRPATGWQPVVTLETLAADCIYPTVAVSPEGDAIVAWFCMDTAGNYRTFARRFVDGDWEASALDVAPQLTDTFTSPEAVPVVAIGGGQVVVAWITSYYAPSAGSYYTLESTSTGTKSAWSEDPYAARAYAYSQYSQQFTGISATMDVKGNAVVVFGLIDPDEGGVYYLRKAATSAWEGTAKIANSIAPDYGYGPFVVSDGDGAMAAWMAYDEMVGGYRPMASRYTKTKKFATPVPIGDPDLIEGAQMYHHGLVSNGKKFFAAWGQYVGSSANAYATQYDIATGKWDALPTVVSDGEASAGAFTSIGVDGHGNALAAFNQVGASGTLLMYARFAASEGTWQPPKELAPDGFNYNVPMLGVADNGVGSVLFYGGGGRDGASYVSTQFRIFK